jgi:glycosyltransferase involved in cell wall biosynthesis
MAAGLPVLVSDFSQISELMQRWNGGALVSPTDPMGAVNCLIDWWQNPLLAQRLGSNNRLAVMEEFNWENLAKILCKVYKSIL